jgi:hypothetical protein
MTREGKQMERADAIKNVVNAIDNFQSDEGNREKDDAGLRNALTELYQYSKENNDSSAMKEGVLAAQAESKKLQDQGLIPDCTISFTEDFTGSVGKVERNWSWGPIKGSTNEFNELGASLQYAGKVLNPAYQLNRISSASDSTKQN